MSRLRVLICRVDERDDAQMTELARVDLPPLRPEWGPACLQLLEAQVAEAGQRLLARLCELHWEDLDAQAVARYGAARRPGRWWATAMRRCRWPAASGRCSCAGRSVPTATAAPTCCPAIACCRRTAAC